MSQRYLISLDTNIVGRMQKALRASNCPKTREALERTLGNLCTYEVVGYPVTNSHETDYKAGLDLTATCVNKPEGGVHTCACGRKHLRHWFVVTNGCLRYCVGTTCVSYLPKARGQIDQHVRCDNCHKKGHREYRECGRIFFKCATCAKAVKSVITAVSTVFHHTHDEPPCIPATAEPCAPCEAKPIDDKLCKRCREPREYQCCPKKESVKAILFELATSSSAFPMIVRLKCNLSHIFENHVVCEKHMKDVVSGYVHCYDPLSPPKRILSICKGYQREATDCKVPECSQCDYTWVKSKLVLKSNLDLDFETNLDLGSSSVNTTHSWKGVLPDSWFNEQPKTPHKCAQTCIKLGNYSSIDMNQVPKRALIAHLEWLCRNHPDSPKIPMISGFPDL